MNNLVYNSDSFVVLQVALGEAEGSGSDEARLQHGGYEIVDKMARKGIYIDGALAESFREGVQALAADHEPSVEELDDYIAVYSELAQQPHALH
ncbi:MAG: DUF3567 family protein [Pseudomonadota bacterium]